jgi:hypothetical protein
VPATRLAQKSAPTSTACRERASSSLSLPILVGSFVLGEENATAESAKLVEVRGVGPKDFARSIASVASPQSSAHPRKSLSQSAPPRRTKTGLEVRASVDCGAVKLTQSGEGSPWIARTRVDGSGGSAAEESWLDAKDAERKIKSKRRSTLRMRRAILIFVDIFGEKRLQYAI